MPDRGCFEGRRWALDLLFGMVRLEGFGIESREEDRERIEGVVGAERSSM